MDRSIPPPTYPHGLALRNAENPVSGSQVKAQCQTNPHIPADKAFSYCEVCGSNQVKVIDSRARATYRYRRYACKCGARWTTHETRVPVLFAVKGGDAIEEP